MVYGDLGRWRFTAFGFEDGPARMDVSRRALQDANGRNFVPKLDFILYY
jgi:hypothetical protein